MSNDNLPPPNVNYPYPLWDEAAVRQCMRDAVAASGAGVPDVVREAVEAAFEGREGWMRKIAAAVRLIAAAPTPDRATKAEAAAVAMTASTIGGRSVEILTTRGRFYGQEIIGYVGESDRLMSWHKNGCMHNADPGADDNLNMSTMRPAAADAPKPDQVREDAATADLHAILAQYPPESWAVRNRAFEEAATIIDAAIGQCTYGIEAWDFADHVASEIRALKAIPAALAAIQAQAGEGGGNADQA
jgi:hypothetical protein